MRVILIGTPRSGTTRLSKVIAKELDLDYIGEPYNNIGEPYNRIFKLKNVDERLKGDNVLCKTLIFDTPLWQEINDIDKIYQSRKKHEEDVKEYIKKRVNTSLSFYTEFIKSYDVVILLTRKNSMDIKKSLQHAIKHFKNVSNWTSPYRKEKDIQIDDQLSLDVDEMIKTIKKLSKLINKKIYYYEDIYCDSDEALNKFISEIKLPLNIENIRDDLATKHRYSQEYRESLI